MEEKVAKIDANNPASDVIVRSCEHFRPNWIFQHSA